MSNVLSRSFVFNCIYQAWIDLSCLPQLHKKFLLWHKFCEESNLNTRVYLTFAMHFASNIYYTGHRASKQFSARCFGPNFNFIPFPFLIFLLSSFYLAQHLFQIFTLLPHIYEKFGDSRFYFAILVCINFSYVWLSYQFEFEI